VMGDGAWTMTLAWTADTCGTGLGGTSQDDAATVTCTDTTSGAFTLDVPGYATLACTSAASEAFSCDGTYVDTTSGLTVTVTFDGTASVDTLSATGTLDATTSVCAMAADVSGTHD